MKKNIVSNTLHIVYPQDTESSFHIRIKQHKAELIAATVSKTLTPYIILILLVIFIILINSIFITYAKTVLIYIYNRFAKQNFNSFK